MAETCLSDFLIRSLLFPAPSSSLSPFPFTYIPRWLGLRPFPCCIMSDIKHCSRRGELCRPTFDLLLVLRRGRGSLCFLTRRCFLAFWFTLSVVECYEGVAV